MKKTLIALAVAASAAVSGSAMAWTANGTGDSVELGGTLTPIDVVTPWEVKVGNAVSGLDANIRKGDTKVSVPVTKAISILGIRTASNDAFMGQTGISPVINFNNAVSDLNNLANADSAVLTLDVTDGTDKIGKMVAPFVAAAQFSVTGPKANMLYESMYAPYSASAFKGGLATEKTVTQAAFAERVAALDSEFAAKFSRQDLTKTSADAGYNGFSDAEHAYSAWYGSGIESGQSITITLDQAVSGDTPIQWKASLPITISYR